MLCRAKVAVEAVELSAAAAFSRACRTRAPRGVSLAEDPPAVGEAFAVKAVGPATDGGTWALMGAHGSAENSIRVSSRYRSIFPSFALFIMEDCSPDVSLWLEHDAKRRSGHIKTRNNFCFIDGLSIFISYHSGC